MMESKKLRIVHTESSCGWGGQEIRILTEALGMMERGHQLHLLCPEESTIYREALARGINVTALPIARKKFKAVSILRQWLKNNPADIINTHSSTDSWLAALATRFLEKTPGIVRTRHVSAPISQNLATRWLYTKATDFIVTTGEKLRETLINKNGFSAENIVSIPTGVDNNHFKTGDKVLRREELNLPKDRFIIGIVATLRSWKGHLYLIEALTQLKLKNFHCVVVGDGPYREVIQDSIKEKKLLSQVTLVGNQADVVPWLQALDLFVLPSYANEGVPQSLIQAMLCQIPVISTPAGSIEELVQHEKTGVIVPCKDSYSLAQMIDSLADNPSLSQQYAKSGYDHASNTFTADKMVLAMENVFLQVDHNKVQS